MRIIAAFCVFFFVVQASAIVVQTNSVSETEPVGLDWSYVYNYKGSSAVAVGGGWLLTAGHVADDGGDGSLTIGTNAYNQQEIVYCPDTDLALVRYDKAFPGYYSLYTTETPTEDLPGLEVLMVGFGNTGTVFADYYTDSGTGKGTKRWGSQIIDRTSIKRYDSNGTVGYTENRGFLMDFDLADPVSRHEAGGGVGDSGGGVFYGTNGVWQLAGIMTSRSGGPQYTGTFAVSIPDYADWITATIPEPAAIGLLGFGTIGLFLARSRKQRRRVGRSLLPIRGDEPLCDSFDADEVDNRKGRAYGSCLPGMLKLLIISPFAAGINVLYAWYRVLNDAVLSGCMAAFEKFSVRKERASMRTKTIVVKGLDAFLEGISWGRMRSARVRVVRSLRLGMLKGLDAFLEIIPWDQMVSAYRRCRKPFGSDDD